MGDMAPRPRGGWQVGNRRRPTADRYDGTQLLPDGQPDVAPDCYVVTRSAAGVFEVKHFADQSAREPRCQFRAERLAADIAAAALEGIDVDIVTLQRTKHDCAIYGARV